MIKQRQISVNRYLQETRGYVSRCAVLAGPLAAILVIAGGRSALNSTTSSLSGWTTLLLTALCVGLIIFNVFAERPLTSKRQMLYLLLGALSGSVSLALLEQRFDSASEALLVICAFLLATSLLGLSHQKPHPQMFQERALARWAFRLDDLLKYDLPAKTRIAMAQIIDALWRSPQDRDDFIPAQNAAIEALVTTLESNIRQGEVETSHDTLRNLSKCLSERNDILGAEIHIEYANANQQQKRLDKPSLDPRRIEQT